jgi:hypothetical protein
MSCATVFFLTVLVSEGAMQSVAIPEHVFSSMMMAVVENGRFED